MTIWAVQILTANPNYDPNDDSKPINFSESKIFQSETEASAFYEDQLKAPLPQGSKWRDLYLLRRDRSSGLPGNIHKYLKHHHVLLDSSGKRHCNDFSKIIET